MSELKFVEMANQIGSFFETMPDRAGAQADIATHIKRFWEPRMRRALLRHIDERGGIGLKDIVLMAASEHRSAMQ